MAELLVSLLMLAALLFAAAAIVEGWRAGRTAMQRRRPNWTDEGAGAQRW